MSREGLSPVWIAVLIVAVLGLSALGFWWARGRAPEPPPQPPAADSAPEARPSGPAEETPRVRPRPDLPPLDASDPVVRDWARALTEHPQLVKWLAPEDLVRRFVATVDNVARGDSPRPHLEFMAPDSSFSAVEQGQGWSADPSSFRRYDLATEVFTSLDIGATVRLYYDMEPLFEKAWAELGDPSITFRQSLARSIDRLLAVEVPDRPPRLQRQVTSYAYADPRLEQMSAAEKHLLRLGPENARRVQTKLRFLRAALDLS